MYDKSLPLIDLHRHLDGNIPPKLIWKLAKEFSIELPVNTESALSDLVLIKDKTSDLLAFIKKLDYGVSVLRNPEACYRVAFENVAMAKAEGLAHTELRFSPFYMASKFDIPLDLVVDAVVSGVKDGNKAHKSAYTLIGILSRTYGVDACRAELNALLSQSDGLKAIDLAGDEVNFPPSLFVEHFKIARDAGLNVTIHAGEAAGPENIWDAIELLGATRIGHGVAAATDNRLMEFMHKHQIGIESCLTSNYQTGAWTDTQNHPIKTFLKHGISTSINTDDPGISNIDLVHEYELAHKTVGLSLSQIQQVQRNAASQRF